MNAKPPVLIYDNLCTSCTAYAKHVNRLLDGKITMLGHYTQQGNDFKDKIFPDGYTGNEMSWFVTDEKAYGGRQGLLQLIKYFFSIRFSLFGIRSCGSYPINNFDISECTTDCRTVKGVMIRSCSILTMGKVIQIGENNG